ncbi:MAG: RagB/SusD family nutrient uptake outer membrane protein [Bacteroidales bacterium]|nr:RagB/SusD family nutrient uptake outer membrane protein [Bacteroidales bacterium]
MKKHIYICSIASLFLLAGCSDFLGVQKYGKPEGWQTDADVMNAVYSLYTFTTGDPEAITGQGIHWFECASDDMTVGRSDANENKIMNFEMTPSNGADVKENWPAMYRTNTKANNIINVVPTIQGLSESVKNKALGTAYFWRGLCMLWIAPYYGDNGPNGGIPIILNDISSEGYDAKRPASVLMNYKQIIEDMKTAAEYLPLFSELPEDEYGLPHKAAAWAFAARAALYAATYDPSYYDVVLDMTKRVMSLTGADKRELYSDGTKESFAKFWTKENNFCSEYLFSLLGNATHGPKFHGMSFQNGGWGLYNFWGYYQPTYDLYEAYEEGDARRDATILMPGQKIRFVSTDIVFGRPPYSIASDTGMTNRKFTSPWKERANGVEYNNDGDNASNTLGTCLIRYADVLLMRAEALIWSQGEGNAEAKQLLNAIRKRAGLPENSNATKAQLKNERRCELAFEFMPSRFVDVVRWGDDEEAFTKPRRKVVPSYDPVSDKVTYTVANFDNGRNYDRAKHHVFAIPVQAFNGTQNLVQNQGY